jgi:Obg family GTPase CgtA
MQSTLLSALTNAKPKIANYPFTTIVPNLGVCYLPEGSLLLADIPGLLEGAHEGKGLGRAFLRHIERCQMLVHVVDISEPGAAQRYLAVNRELALYSALLAAKPQVLVLNKADLLTSTQLQAARQIMQKVVPHSRILCLSAHRFAARRRGAAGVHSVASGEEEEDDSGVGELLQRMWAFLCKLKADQARTAAATAFPLAPSSPCTR